jgi:hypothetical protein
MRRRAVHAELVKQTFIPEEVPLRGKVLKRCPFGQPKSLTLTVTVRQTQSHHGTWFGSHSVSDVSESQSHVPPTPPERVRQRRKAL